LCKGVYLRNAGNKLTTKPKRMSGSGQASKAELKEGQGGKGKPIYRVGPQIPPPYTVN
jgi:hypothetical protein